MTLHVPRGDLAVSNTPMLSESNEAGGMKMVKFKASPPLPSYLVAFAVGHFDVVDAGKVGKTPLRVIVPHGKAGEAIYAAKAIPQLLKLLENYFGIPYPYEKLDSVVMPISNFAMENAGLITYEENMLLANPQHDTINRQRELATFCAHEMAHQWFGDLVTMAVVERHLAERSLRDLDGNQNRGRVEARVAFRCGRSQYTNRRHAPGQSDLGTRDPAAHSFE